jgi:protein SCO1/2
VDVDRSWRSVVALSALLLATACAGTAGAPSGAAAPAPSAAATVTAGSPEARRAAAQLQVEAIAGAGGGPFVGRELEPPLYPPRATLTDTEGEPFDLPGDLTAPVTLVYFGYTTCPDVCPTHMAGIAAALEELPPATAEAIDVLFVSVDPVNDDAEQLRSYLDSFDERFIGLTGTPEEVNAAMASAGLPPTAIAAASQYPPDHPSDVLAYTADGRAPVAYPYGTAPRAYVDDLPALIDGPARS